MLVLWTIVIGVLLIVLVVRKLNHKRLHLAPAPPGLPFIGNVFQLDKDSPHGTVTTWSHQLGPVFRFKVFGRDFLVLNNYETIYEALVTKGTLFAGRNNSYRAQVLLDFSDEITFGTYSPNWSFMKKTTMQALKMYGDNLEKLELITLEVIEDLLKGLGEESSQGPVDMKPFIHRCTTGIISSILYGYKIDEKKVRSILETIEEGGKLLQPTGTKVFLDIFPWLRHFPNTVYTQLLGVAAKTRDWFLQELENRKSQRQPGDPQCLVDGLFDVQKKAEETQSEHRLSDLSIYGINHDVIFAATDAMTVIIYSLIAVLVNKPDLQKKMADNILCVLGDRPPRLSDRKSLTIIEAAILETLRYSSITPLNVPHSTTEDTSINGFDIPKGTEVMFNLWKLHHDPEYWDDPWEFKPDRFLDADGSLVSTDHINRKRLLPFSAGKRMCLGETLAKNRLFLIVTSLLQKYEFSPAAADQAPKHDPRDNELSFGIHPIRYCVKLVPRM